MFAYQFDITEPVSYVITGKFVAPSDTWKHQEFPLGEFELFVITEGTLYISYDGRNYEVPQGHFLLLAPSTSMRYGYRPSYCSFYWLHFGVNDKNVNKVLTDNSEYIASPKVITIPVTGKLPHYDRAVVILKQLQDSVRSHYSKICLDYMTTSILCELHSQFEPSEIEESVGASTGKQLYNDILDYINLNYQKNIRIIDVAAHFKYNEKYLSHLFAGFAGITLKQYLLKVKMDTANFLLSDTNRSISEIAAELGFIDSHNFSRAYKKVTGLSPSDYRNSYCKRLLFNK